jgi:UTP--glucose-1-phosphate uridylyltransferase
MRDQHLLGRAGASAQHYVRLRSLAPPLVGYPDHRRLQDARAIYVPRPRFAPVKTTDDLLVVRSDAYELTGDGQMRPGFDGPGPVVSLDTDFYKLLPDFEQRFPAGVPSLRRCRQFDVEGDVTFGAGVTAVGDVRVAGPRHVPDGEVLGG